jgi:hypothetical protein
MHYEVYNEKHKWVSGCEAPENADRSTLEYNYALGCGWPSVEAMKEYYPVDRFTFIGINGRIKRGKS